jgi:hypothetical protein
VRAIPARRIGYLIPSRSHKGVWRVGGAMVIGTIFDVVVVWAFYESKM